MGRAAVALLLLITVAGCRSRPAPVPPSAKKFVQPPGLALFAGLPRAKYEDAKFVALSNEGYVIGYSETRRNPLWAAYRLFPVDDPTSHERPSHFKIDPRTEARVKHDCYTNSGYDRGHNAPNSAIDTRYGQGAQKETFMMSNVMPQKCGLNREPWQALEKLVERYADELTELHVLSGPIFSGMPSMIGCGVEVPIAFFKVIIENETSALPRMLAAVMVQDDAGDQHPLRDFVVTVDCIEKLTGLDLFPDLPDELEAVLEADKADADWDLDTILVPTATCPGRQDEELGAEQRRVLFASCGL